MVVELQDGDGTGSSLLEMMQYPCNGCSQTFFDPCINLKCAPLGGYICM